MNRGKHLLDNKKTSLITAIILVLVSIIYTVLVCVVDKAPIGPEGTSVGFSAINGAFADAVGLNLLWDKITDVMMIIAILVAVSFVALGAYQLIKRKSLLKVDRAILAMAGVYLVIVVLYVLFDKVPLNYRPVILPDETAPEASFPSSHTLVICTILCTAIVAWDRIFYNKKLLCNILRICAAVVMLVSVAGRLIAGVHWLTDIIAGVIFSATITAIYIAALDRIDS